MAAVNSSYDRLAGRVDWLFAYGDIVGDRLVHALCDLDPLAMEAQFMEWIINMFVAAQEDVPPDVWNYGFPSGSP